jgi:tRNA wybutosine-synthesizing protein 3
MNKTLVDSRFAMLKKHHTQTLKEAMAKDQVDAPVIPFLLKVTEIPNIYTSSSCSGRLLLLGGDEEENKKVSGFVNRYHRLVTYEEIKRDVDNFNTGYLWLKVEPFIFHFATKDYDKAKEILDFCREKGLKKAGIISAKEGRFTCEVTHTVFMSTLIKIDKKQLIPDEYLKQIVEIANKKLESNFKKLEDFESAFLKTFPSKPKLKKK